MNHRSIWALALRPHCCPDPTFLSDFARRPILKMLFESWKRLRRQLLRWPAAAGGWFLKFSDVLLVVLYHDPDELLVEVGDQFPCVSLSRARLQTLAREQVSSPNGGLCIEQGDASPQALHAGRAVALSLDLASEAQSHRCCLDLILAGRSPSRQGNVMMHMDDTTVDRVTDDANSVRLRPQVSTRCLHRATIQHQSKRNTVSVPITWASSVVSISAVTSVKLSASKAGG